MTTTTWQPGDTLPYLLNENGYWDRAGGDCHDLVEVHLDHQCLGSSVRCFYLRDWADSDWNWASQLGKHDDTAPPLPWLHGRVAS